VPVDDRAGWFPRGRRHALAAIGTAVGLVLVACGEGATSDDAAPAAQTPASSAPAPEPGTPTPSSSPAATGVVVATGDSDYGPMLFDQRGQAIYLFEKETAGQPDCYDECAIAWPPVLTAGQPQATGDVRPELLGVVMRTDGSTQVTYGGHPLYFYAHEAAGQVLCHDVVENGGRWLVVTPEGTPGPV
jgi:predicted lipoprotein with Yx(FWY)xxD motif